LTTGTEPIALDGQCRQMDDSNGMTSVLASLDKS